MSFQYNFLSYNSSRLQNVTFLLSDTVFGYLGTSVITKLESTGKLRYVDDRQATTGLKHSP